MAELSKLRSVLDSYVNSEHPLNVSGADLSSPKEVDTLLEFLSNSLASVVVLDGCRVSDKGCTKIADHLRKSETIKVLSLRNNDMGNSGAKALAKAIKSNKICTHLNVLGNRNIGSKFVDTLCNAYLGSSTLLSLCGVWPEGIPSSKEVHVDSLSPVDVRLLSSELGKGKSELISLDLSCEQGGNPDYEAIIRALEFNSRLISLSCSNFKLDVQSESFVGTFREALSSNSSLKTLTLIHSGTSSTYARRALGDLLKGLQANRGLTTLRLDGFNALSSEGDDSTLTTALLDMLKGNRSLLHLNLYREDFLNDNRPDDTTNLAPLLAKALSRSKLRLLRLTTVASPSDAMSETKREASKTFLSSLLSAADEMVMKRKLKPLIIRFNEDEHLSGKPPTGREEVEFLDWEVQDQVNYIKDESNHDDSMPSRIMSVFETMDGKGEDASIYLHYSVQLLDSSFSLRSDVSPANFVEMFSIDHRSRPYTLFKGSLNGVADVPIAKTIEGEEGNEKGDKRKKKKKLDKKGNKEQKEGDRREKKGNGEEEKEDTKNGEGEKRIVEKEKAKEEEKRDKKEKKNKKEKNDKNDEKDKGKPALKVDETQYAEPKTDKLVGVRFYGDPSYYLAAILHNDRNGLVDIVLMDGTDEIERVDETMLRSVDQDSHELPKNCDHCDKGFYRKNDVVDVKLKGKNEVIEAKVVKVIAKKGIYDLEPTTGGETMTRVSGRFIMPKVLKGKKCGVILGRDGDKEYQSDVESGSVVEVGENNDKFDQYTVKLRSGKTVKVGARQMLFYNRDSVRSIAVDEFEAYSGLKSKAAVDAKVDMPVEVAADDGVGEKSQEEREHVVKKEKPASPDRSDKAPITPTPTSKDSQTKKGATKNEATKSEGDDGSSKKGANVLPSRTPKMGEISTMVLKELAEIEAAKEAEAAAFDDMLAGGGLNVPMPETKSEGSSAPHLQVASPPRGTPTSVIDSPEVRFGALMQRKSKDLGSGESKGEIVSGRKNAKVREDDDHAVVVLGSSTERITSVKKHAHKPSYQRNFSRVDHSVPLGFPGDRFPKPFAATSFAGDDILMSATTRTPLSRGKAGGNRPISVGEGETDFQGQPEPPAYPRSSNTAPGRLRQVEERISYGSPPTLNLDEPPSTVDGLYSEIVVMQQALDGEAEVLRKAMSLLDARKKGSALTLSNNFLGGQIDSYAINTHVTDGHTIGTAFESRFPHLGSKGLDTTDILSPVKMPQFMERYPAPVTQRVKASTADSNPFSTATALKLASPVLEALEPNHILPQSAQSRTSDSEAQVNHGKLSHGQIAGLVVIAEQKGLKSVRLFVEKIFNKDSPQSGAIMKLFSSNGYDTEDRLHDLFSTLAEAAAATSPVAFLRSQLEGEISLLSGHAQKILASFAELLIDAESYKRYGL